MSRKWAYVSLAFVALVFLFGIFDISFDVEQSGVPAEILRLSAVVLSGVAIGTILVGLRRNGSDDSATTDRSRQTARIARQDIDDHE